jgi:hypothetical protein
MSERMTVTRRTLMNTAAAAGAAGVLGGIAQAQAPTTSLPVPGVTEVTADRRYGMSRRHDCAPPLPAALVDRGTSGILHREGRQRPADRLRLFRG